MGINKEMVRTEDGKVRRKFFTLVVRGKLMAYAGSPRSDGTFWNLGVGSPPPNETIPANSRLASLKAKMGALERIFSADGKWFEIQPWDGSASIKCQPVIKSVEFAAGERNAWTEYVDYTIQMEAANVYFGDQDGGGGLFGVEPEESWGFEVDNQNTRAYRVTHTVASQQKATFDSDGTLLADGWENAKIVVLTALGQSPPSGVVPPLIDAGPYYATNYIRTQTIDEANGRFSASESWVYVAGQPYAEEYVVNCRIQDGRVRVTVDGTVTGFALSDPAQSVLAWQEERFSRATAAWAVISTQLLSRAQSYSGVSLNPLILSEQVGFNPVNGLVTYNVEFDNRPPSLVAGSLSENLSVSQQNPQDIFASLVVLGRSLGPVLQSIGTVGPSSRTVTLEVVMPPWKYADGTVVPLSPDVSALLATFYPSGGFITRDDESWLPHTGRYSRNISWTYVFVPPG